MDPYKPGVYVSLDSYFTYLKKNRVNELELIAQDLGAKSFRVTFKEHQKVIVKKSARKTQLTCHCRLVPLGRMTEVW